MDMPPSRYKVVEKGRRLVVVDTLTGSEVTRSDPAQPARATPLAERRVPSPPPSPLPQSQGWSAPPSANGVFTTQGWFDEKAPRQLRLGDSARSGAMFVALALLFMGSVLLAMFGLPGVIVGFVILANIRKWIRGGITKWLDGMET